MVADWDRDRPQREWFTLHSADGWYEVFAYSPAKALEHFQLWAKSPVEVNWIRRIPAPEYQTTEGA